MTMVVELSPSAPNFPKDSWKLLLLAISISCPSLVTYCLVQKIYSKMHPVSCTNIHLDVTDLVNHGMVKNTKTWIPWKQNITFLRNKNFFELYFRWHILRSYRFLVELNFNHGVNPVPESIRDDVLESSICKALPLTGHEVKLIIFKHVIVNDNWSLTRLHVSKVSWKFCISTINNFAVIYPGNLLFFKKVAYFLTISVVFSVYKQNYTAQ